jgi:hypothetical protein
MTPADAKLFAQSMQLLFATYDKELGDLRLEAYALALDDIEVAVIKAAVIDAIRTRKFLPTPAELRESIDGGTGDELAMHAWVDLSIAIPKVGPYSTLLVRDRAWALAVEDVFGGWPEAVRARADLEEPSWQAKRKEFIPAYARRRRTVEKTGTLAILPGLHDRHNRDGQASWRDGLVDTLFKRGRWCWALEADHSFHQLRTPYDEANGLPLLPEAERCLAFPVRYVPALPPPTEIEPVSKEVFEAQLAKVLSAQTRVVLQLPGSTSPEEIQQPEAMPGGGV